MADSLKLEERKAHLGAQQKRILLWLSEREKLVTPDQIKERWPPAYDLPSWLSGPRALAEIMESSALVGRLPPEEEEYLRILEGAKDDPGIRWSAKVFLDHAPTRVESASLSGSIDTLAQRGLIKKHKRVSGKRTTRLSLTRHGALVALMIRREE